MVINVGITEEQKRGIEKILEGRKDKYRSTNNLVQVAVDMLIEKEFKSTETEGESEINTVLGKIDIILDALLEDELEEKVDLNRETLSSINVLSQATKQLRNQISHKSNKRAILLIAINFRNKINSLISNLEEVDGDEKSIVNRIDEIEELKEKLIKEIKAIKR